MNKILIVADNQPFITKDGVTAALNSLINTFEDNLENLSIINSTNYNFYKYSNESIIIENKKLDIELTSQYNILVFSPISSYFNNKKIITKNHKVIIQLSDCLTYELWVSFRLSIKFKQINLKKLLQIPFYYFQEKKAIKRADLILLQTPKDVEITKKIFKTNKAISFPNIIDIKSHININYNNSIGWCASFTGEYLKLANWFSKNILIPFLKENPNITIEFLGKYSDDFAKSLKTKNVIIMNQINNSEYVENISDFYSKHKVIITPVFKGYGLINKTVEALLSGSLVLGDSTSFNGIDVVHMKNCIISNTINEFKTSLNQIFNIMTDVDIRNIRENAKKIYDSKKIFDDNKSKLNIFLSDTSRLNES